MGRALTQWPPTVTVHQDFPFLGLGLGTRSGGPHSDELEMSKLMQEII